MSKQKEIKLRAFTIEKDVNISMSRSVVIPMLNEKLNGTAAIERMLKRSSNKEDKEYDLVASSKFDNNTIFGVMVRVELDSTSPKVPSGLLASQSFQISDLQEEDGESTIYKKHYYFCINDTHLVTNLPGNTTITGFQTYLNWLLDTATAPYAITPLCKSTPDVKLSEIKEVVFEDDSILLSSRNTSITAINDTADKLIDIAWASVRNLLSETIDLTEEELKHVVSARLLLKFKKPKEMSEEDYQKKFGAMLKPVSDTDHLHYISKSGQRITADTITATKTFNIEITDKGFLVEEQLRQSMIVFLNELASR